MTDKTKKYLYDIWESVQSIETFIGDIDFFQYQKNKMIKRAVERELEIIGEVMNKLLSINSEIKITSSKRIIGMRNRVIYGYDLIDDGVVWGTVKKHLPILKNEVGNLLN
ncbi:MAG: DUF86 domain-containing protein [Bacteroidales bacterium]|nr:DUF86 domain-containing protein [Bacteroidales bacterium]